MIPGAAGQGSPASEGARGEPQLLILSSAFRGHVEAPGLGSEVHQMCEGSVELPPPCPHDGAGENGPPQKHYGEGTNSDFLCSPP